MSGKMDFDALVSKSKDEVLDLLKRKTLSPDDELKLLGAAYAHLYLSSKKPNSDLCEAHELIAVCYKKIGDNKFFDKHIVASRSYGTSN